MTPEGGTPLLARAAPAAAAEARVPAPASSAASAAASSPAAALAPGQEPRSLVDLLERSLARYAALPLFVVKAGDQWQEVTFAEFGARVDRLRAGLAAAGVGAGDRVGIIANNRLEWAVLAYACYGRGAAIVPMYESQRPEEWAFIAADAGLKLLFAGSAAIRDQLVDLPARVPSLARVLTLEPADPDFAALDGAGHPAVPARHPGPDEIACLLYTSGTTGEPKGVTLSHRNVVSNVTALYQVIPLATSHRTLSFLPWAHAFGHTVELHMLVAAGGSAAIAESVERLAANLVEVRPTVLVAVPRVFLKIYAGVEKLMAGKPAPIRALFRGGVALALRRRRGERLGPWQRLRLLLADRLIFAKIRARFGGRLEFAVSGAAALAREVMEFMEALGIPVYEGYGLTETSPIVSANVPGAHKPGSVGRPLPGVRVVIDRASGAGGQGDDPGDGDGEIVVHGPNVMVGYHQRQGDTQAVFAADGGLRTGDLGRLDRDGYLYITGRIKEQFKLENGKYVVPGPLEERLKLSPLIANVVVHGENRPCTVALVVPHLDVLRAHAARVDPSLARASDRALCASAAARAAVGAELDRLSADWKGYERVRGCLVLAEDFTQANDMLTPSLKVKRRNVLARFGAEVEGLYRELRAAAP